MRDDDILFYYAKLWFPGLLVCGSTIAKKVTVDIVAALRTVGILGKGLYVLL